MAEIQDKQRELDMHRRDRRKIWKSNTETER